MNRRVALLLLAVLGAAAPFASGQSSSLHVVQENGPRSQRINIVFLSEGYTAANMGGFATHVQNAANYLFTREPWQQYRSYCNVYRIQIASNQSGTDNGAAGGLRDTYFNSGFNTPSVPQLLTFDGTGQSRAYTLLNTHVPEYDVPILLVNDTKYGGSGGPIVVASIHASSAQVVEHEIGHSFAGLGDEYDIDYPSYSPQEMPNVTQQTARNLIKWRHRIEASTPVPTPETNAYDALAGLFEGAMYRTTGWYRPHNNSLMRSLNRPCGQINREQFVLSYYERISPLDGFTPTQLTRTVTTFENLSFSVTPKSPSSGPALQVTWSIDGQTQTDATVNSFTVTSDALGNGTHTVAATVHDRTPFVRNDPAGLLSDTRTWTLTLSNQLPPTLAAWRAAFGADNANPAGDGFVNLLKYRLGIDPARPAAFAQVPRASLTTSDGAQYLTLTVSRRTRRSDVTTLVEISSDLATWHSGLGHTVTLQDEDHLLVVRDANPITGSPQRAMRVKVQTP